METEMKVLLFLKKSEKNASGLCPLMGKITVKGAKNSIAQFGCKLSINPDLWNPTAQRCMGKSKPAIVGNQKIESFLLLIRLRFNELCNTHTSVSALDVKNAFQGIAAAQVTLLKLFQEHNEEYALRVGVNRVEATYVQYINTYHMLSGFIASKYKVSDIAIKSLTESFVEEFDVYMRVEKMYKPNTISGHIIRTKRVVRTAIYRGIITVDPFADFSPEKGEKKQLYLTTDEFSRLMNTTFDTPNRNFTRDMFLFSAFTGLSYCDLEKLSLSEIITDNDGNLWIETNRKKTGTPENVMLLDIAVRIIKKYEGVAKDGKVFPMLSKESLNPHLKKIAKLCGITRNLHFHLARHTFASLICLQYGVPIETVSKAMGHKNVSTTQRYAKVTHDKIDQDISALHDTISGKYSLRGIDAPPSTILKYRESRRRKIEENNRKSGGE